MDISRRTVLAGALAAVPVALLAAGAVDPAVADPLDPSEGGTGLASTGRPVVQQIQRALVERYGSRSGFPAVVADGRYRGDTQQAIIHALQLEIGLADDVANGSFGPLTRSTLKATPAAVGLAVGAADGQAATDSWLGHLLQAAVVVNTTWDGPFDGAFSAEQATRVAQFQRSVALPETGAADFPTWASLLSSTGDTDRPGTAVDCITVITAARAATLKDAGYGIVGRYLTDSPVAGALEKQIADGELATIFGAGLRVFPIFQEGGTDATAFSYDRGTYSAGRAHEAAAARGFLPGTTIYYAVDFDATDAEVHDQVMPYFRGVRDELARRGSAYAVGVYAGRSICSELASAHLTSASFVADMSTGWGVNTAERLPVDWAFDQILEYSIGTGEGAVGIDKDIVSGRDPGQSAVAPVG